MNPAIPEFTREQMAGLTITRNKPLIICDVDEVVVHFVRAFEDYLGENELWLDTSSFALNRNVRRKADDSALADEHVSRVIDAFFVDRTETLPPIDGAVAALDALAQSSTVVMLTNLPHHARDKRIRNLRDLGLHFPVITNSGPKGPAINHLASLTDQPIVFIDDSPGFIESARSHAPAVHLVHFMQDKRYAQHITPFDFVSLYTDSWDVALPHIKTIVKA